MLYCSGENAARLASAVHSRTALCGLSQFSCEVQTRRSLSASRRECLFRAARSLSCVDTLRYPPPHLLDLPPPLRQVGRTKTRYLTTTQGSCSIASSQGEADPRPTDYTSCDGRSGRVTEESGLCETFMDDIGVFLLETEFCLPAGRKRPAHAAPSQLE
jgi:hypothetical protein